MNGRGSRIDAHHHVWDLDERAQPWIEHDVLARTFSTAEHEALLSAHGFSGAVVVQSLCEEAETADLLAMADERPWIQGVVGWVDLAGDVDAGVARLRASPGGEKLVGIRHQVQMEDDAEWLARADVRHGLGRLAAHGLAFDAVVRPDQLGSVVDAAHELGELRWVLDHLGNPAGGAADEEWVAHIRALGDLPHVAAKISGLGNLVGQGWTPAVLQPVVGLAIEAFGADRLMFGSDWPVCLITGDVARVVDAAEEWCASLDAAEAADVFGGTAGRWYAL